MILPHRLMPYSSRVMEEAHGRKVTGVESIAIENQWMNQSCCMPRQNCVVRFSLPLMLISHYGMITVLGKKIVAID
jgi:hypothetical protein